MKVSSCTSVPGFLGEKKSIIHPFGRIFVLPSSVSEEIVRVFLVEKSHLFCVCKDEVVLLSLEKVKFGRGTEGKKKEMFSPTELR